jgi:hypothetical protein
MEIVKSHKNVFEERRSIYKVINLLGKLIIYINIFIPKPIEGLNDFSWLHNFKHVSG